MNCTCGTIIRTRQVQSLTPSTMLFCWQRRLRPVPEMDIVDTLPAARDIVAESWCQHAPAQTASGRGVLANHPDAVSWCMAGAIEKATGNDYTSDAHLFVYQYLVDEKHVGIFGFND